ncbi:neuropeptide Y receptor type 4-2-like isoform X1 [Amphiprion ocellaris]|uniref:G-protein coupled receptors family 1 profile domain-containing protein n=1 Tax=Amphiprion ocellaris TaxID=80972 RepID=A0AAQ5XVK3_AMPOC|nr:neuropeptide Y receptor type 4-2-like isoform X1 [Amphiprion ocellaris]XP_054874788.1 neuropeptide Y receptor type 4-2-like isoform X1 [Amphiprion ocellaris]
MSLSGNASQLSSSTLPLPLLFNSSTSTHSLPWERERVGRESVQEWSGNKTELLSDLSVLGHDEQCHMSPVLTACLVVWYSITMVLGLVGNTGLICIIARRREKANVTSIFICNLSFSDIVVCVFCLPFTVIYTLMDHWVFGSLLCRLVPFIQCVSVTVSVLSLVFIALERHQLIINPSGWKPSVSQAYVVVIIIWILACFTSSPFLAFQLLTNEPYANVLLPQSPLHHQASPQAYINTSPPQPVLHTFKNSSIPPNSHRSIFSYIPTTHMEACVEHWPSHQHRVAYTTWLLLFQYCGPLLLVLLCYVRVFVRLRHRKDMLDRARTTENQRMTHSRRINIMLVALITAFALCWLPLTIFNVISDWNQEALPICHHNLLFSLCHLLAMSSTCINPIIYGFLNSNFRQEVREVLLHCRCYPLEEECERFPMSTVHMEVSRTSVPPHCRNNSV